MNSCVSELNPVKTLLSTNGHWRASPNTEKEYIPMLWTVALILLVLWMLGLATAYTMSGFIHILLAIAIVLVLVRVMQRRRVA
jgi:hypothetical protein